MVSVTLFEGIVLLIMSGVSVVIWWGIKREVEGGDHRSKCLDSINVHLSKICERLGKSDTWMELHTKQDDERHEEIKRIYGELWKIVTNINLKP